MGGVQPSKLQDSNIITGLSYLEDGQFAKIYKGNLLTSQSSFGSTTSNYSGQQNGHAASGPKQIVSIKVPRVPESIRKEKSKPSYRVILTMLIN